MHFKALILASVVALAAAATAPEAAGPVVIPASEAAAEAANALMKRGCVYDGCRCRPGHGGLHCYGRNVYQCNNNGSCCNYGYRKSCAQCGRLKC